MKDASTKEVDDWISRLYEAHMLTEDEVNQLCNKAKEVLEREGNVKKVNSPVKVCGDIHGQFEDLLKLFEVGGLCPDVNYLFLGDYVDRGYDSVETISLLLALKVRYPDNITLLRGNHECRETTTVYGFYDECFRKYNTADVWRAFTDVFDYLPISGLIDEQIFCAHGGLSPDINNIDDIAFINRHQEVPREGEMCDLLWSDPHSEVGWLLSKRGISFEYGFDSSEKFNYSNNLSMIARAHELVEGYLWWHDENVLSLFSAPNYCHRFSNQAAIFNVDGSGEHLFQVFEAAFENEI